MKDDEDTHDRPGSRKRTGSKGRGSKPEPVVREEATESETPVFKPGLGKTPKKRVLSRVPIRAELGESFENTFKTDMHYRRVVATAADALRYHANFKAKPEELAEVIEVAYGKLRLMVRGDVISKMLGWVSERSRGYTLEVQGRFLAKRRPDHLFVDEFIPIPSFCQSLAYETSGPDDRRERFGNAKMRTIGLDDWKPMETCVYEALGIFSQSEQIPIDPLKVPIPFHSHYLRSEYQEGPSPGDYDHIFHIKWVYTPKSGKNILYSGISPFQVALERRFPQSVAPPKDAELLANQDDCELWVLTAAGQTRHPIGADGLVIGRHHSCAVVLDDPDVSRQHTKLSWTEKGELVVEDMGSRNGTLAAGKRIDRLTIDAPIELLVGNTKLRVCF